MQAEWEAAAAAVWEGAAAVLLLGVVISAAQSLLLRLYGDPED